MITNIGKRQILSHLPATRARLLQLCHNESSRHTNKLDSAITTLMKKGIVKNRVDIVKIDGEEKPVSTIVLNEGEETQAA